jgi:hypothetical protein
LNSGLSAQQLMMGAPPKVMLKAGGGGAITILETIVKQLSITRGISVAPQRGKIERGGDDGDQQAAWAA